MSAIWGIIPFSAPLPEQADEKIRAYYQEHCRIDCIQTRQDSCCLMGCGLQYITEEAVREALPIFDREREIFFTADCVLDNRRELLQELSAPASEPDGTLMYLAYLKWGMDCLRHFRGAFSLAIYNNKEKTLYLAADQTASRCLYYHIENGAAAFSTLLGPLRSLPAPVRVNEYYIKDFLTAPGLAPNVSSTETPYENVFKLNPGTYQKITPGSREEVVYWTPALSGSPCHCTSPGEYGRFFRELYEKCVEDVLRSRGETGISLSSGLDSASVGALAAGALDSRGKMLYSYTYVPCEKPSPDKNRFHIQDETEDVLKITALHPNIVPRFLNNGGKNCFEEIPKGLRVMEIPYKAYGNLPSLFEVYENAYRDGCRIVLTGQMGNSTVSHGYIDDILYDLWLHGNYIRFLGCLNRYSKTVKESRKKALRGCLNYFRYAKKESASGFSYVSDNPFLSKEITRDYPLQERYLQAGIPTKGGLPSSCSFYREHLYSRNALTYLGELDTKAGLAHGILLRDPTRDMRMLSFCLHLPYHLFAWDGTPRWLIRGNLRDILPPELLDNWMRYGVQNSDCHSRLMRDWERIYPRLEEHLASPGLQPYIDAGKCGKFLANYRAALPETAEDETSYLLMLEVLGLFLSDQFEKSH